LSEAHGSWSNNPTSFAYQWLNCDRGGSHCSGIAGATGQAYTLTGADVGKTVEVHETARNAAGPGTPASSAATAVVSSPPVAAPAVIVAARSRAASLSASVNPEGLATNVHFESGLDPKYGEGGTVVYSQMSPTRAVTADFARHEVVFTLGNLVPNAVYHVRLVASNSAGTTVGRDHTFTTLRSASPAAPTLGRTVNLTPVRGLVLVKPRGSNSSAGAGHGYLPLTQVRQFAVGSEVDARRGTLLLQTRNASHAHATHRARVSGGVFSLSQTHGGQAKGSTTLTLLNNPPGGARCTAAHPRRVRQTLKLTAPRGATVRTRGRSSSATATGSTTMETVERCDGTLTIVRRGTVRVQVFRLHRTIKVIAGGRYLARRKG
jgi:hypothetical protein